METSLLTLISTLIAFEYQENLASRMFRYFLGSVATVGSKETSLVIATHHDLNLTCDAKHRDSMEESQKGIKI